MRTIDLSVYLVLDPVLCQGFDGMLRTAQLASQAGATAVQLRAPAWKKRDLVACARALKALLAPQGIPLIINDHADVCLASDADGLHIGQQDLSAADARALIGSDRVLGLSVSSLEQLRQVDVRLVDHLGVGPIFSTATKPDAAQALGLDGFAQLARLKPCPVVAIGSVKYATIAPLIAAGADGIAVVSAICGQPDVSAATRALRQAVDTAKRAHIH